VTFVDDNDDIVHCFKFTLYTEIIFVLLFCKRGHHISFGWARTEFYFSIILKGKCLFSTQS